MIPPYHRLAKYAVAALLCGAVSLAISQEKPQEPSKPASHTKLDLQGWTVRMDDRLRVPIQEALGKQAIALLDAKLADIRRMMLPAHVAKLQRVSIVLDLSHGSLTSMQYHPSEDWLVEHGFSRELGKCVHIPVAEAFASAKHNHIQPWCVLHELAHAFHDQVLGFEEPRIKLAWERYAQSGQGRRALHVDGRVVRHYALTNHKEFFAEMSEAYFGTNDFFPFVQGELKQAEPEIYSLLREVWGEAPPTG